MPENGPEAKSIFMRAIESYEQDAWPAFLDEACGKDADLRREVERLLQAHLELGSIRGAGASVVSETTDAVSVERPGTQIGPYKLLQELGKGGMGVVYMAEQSRPVERRVALKVIRPGMDSREVIARFEAERQALALMDHPNIAKVLDANTTESGRPYFVMELVRGVPITKYCDDKQLNPRERLELFVPICQAVQHAHQKGIIHRDLKPSNVLVALYDGVPVPKVIDFGVAKATSQKLTEKTMFTQFGQIVGTLEYMSPEQAEINQLDIDTRSDVYSLGVLLYELLTGVTPFERRRLQSAALDEMLRIIREEEPPRPSIRLSSVETLPTVAANRQTDPQKLKSFVRGELDWIVMKALEKDRSRRYETANGLALDIERYLQDEPVAAGPPSTSYRFRKFVTRNKTAVAGTLAIVISLIAGMAGIATGYIQSEKSREELARLNTTLRERNSQLSQMLLHEAVAAAMNAEKERTEQLVQAAATTGTGEVQAQLVKGILDEALGDLDAALIHLHRALDLDEKSVPVHCNLASAYVGIGSWDLYIRHRRRASELTPTTAEDYLFLGQLHLNDDPRNAVPLFEASLKLHKSPLTRLFLAGANGYSAFVTRDLQATQEALLEIGKAEMLLGSDHRVCRRMKMQLIGCSVAISEYFGQELPNRESQLTVADQCAAESVASRRPVDNALAAIHYEFIRNDLDRAESAWRRAVATDRGNLWRNYYAAFVMRKYGLARCLEVLRVIPGAEQRYSEFQKATLLALSDDRQDEAKKWWEENRHSLQPRDYAWAILVPLLLRDTDGLEEVARAPGCPPGEEPKVAYIGGRLSEPEFLNRIKDDPWAHYWAAMKALSVRDTEGRAKARRHFEAILAMRSYWGPNYFIHNWANGFLAEMNQRPDWPGPLK